MKRKAGDNLGSLYFGLIGTLLPLLGCPMLWRLFDVICDHHFKLKIWKALLKKGLKVTASLVHTHYQQSELFKRPTLANRFFFCEHCFF